MHLCDHSRAPSPVHATIFLLLLSSCPTNTHQLTMFDSQDTQITTGARVFYMAYDWVQEYWPDSVAMPESHITAHPACLYLDGKDTGVQLTAKIRMYRKAVHLVICEWAHVLSALACACLCLPCQQALLLDMRPYL